MLCLRQPLPVVSIKPRPSALLAAWSTMVRSARGREMTVAGSRSGSRSPRRTPTPLTTIQFHARSAPGSRRSASSPELQLYVSGCATEPGAATTATLLRPVPPTSSPPWFEKSHHEALESFSVVSQARQHGQSAAATPDACRACRGAEVQSNPSDQSVQIVQSTLATRVPSSGWRWRPRRSDRLWPSRRCASGRARCSTTGWTQPGPCATS